MKRIHEVWVAKPKGRACWQVFGWEVGADGKRRQCKRSSGSALKRDALRLRDGVRQQLRLGTVPKDDLPWDAFLKEFLDKEVKPKPRRTRESCAY